MTARIDGDFVVFLIGIRINKPLRVNRWLPVMRAMPRMLAELRQQPEFGFLHGETWFGRTAMMVQYWRSFEQLMAYASNRAAQHLPAWRDFNRAIGTDGTVGIWHETYTASPGTYETIYANMPQFGLGKAGTLEPAEGRNRTARDRIMRPD